MDSRLRGNDAKSVALSVMLARMRLRGDDGWGGHAPGLLPVSLPLLAQELPNLVTLLGVVKQEEQKAL
jgi:hypothetical protein